MFTWRPPVSTSRGVIACCLLPASNTPAPFWHNPTVRAEDRPRAPRTSYRRPSMRRPLLRAQVNKRGNPWQEPLYALLLAGPHVYMVAAVLLEAQATVDPEAHGRATRCARVRLPYRRAAVGFERHRRAQTLPSGLRQRGDVVNARDPRCHEERRGGDGFAVDPA